MLISPPFLPAPTDGESDEAYVNRAMQGGIPGDGGFPLSFDLNWHGGIHLTAPQEGTTHLPVRAIADGTLVYVRQPTDESSAPADHGLRYRDKWTDNGCIVLKHETEIGEGVGASVIFYSIYMHLSQITLATPTKGAKIYRKDELGKAGRIYGQNHRIHFEIIADQSQIAKLVGRSERLLDHQSGNGRTDSCWGDMYFFIPPEVLVYEAAPTNRLQSENSAPVAYRCPAMPTGAAPVLEGGSAAGKTEPTPRIQGYEWAVALELQQGIFVRMRYERGQCTLTSFLISGEEIGSHQEEADYEYNLYRTATSIYPQRPSAGYELLRFGRILGPDTLQPAEAAHWRQIALPSRSGGPETGWVNLNATTVATFSDADFPHWQGWQLVDDDTDSDSHCQSPFIRSLLRLDDDKMASDQVDAVSIALSPAYARMSEEEKLKMSERYERERVQNEAALLDEVVQKQLKRLICQFPSEWVKNDFDTRYGWLKKVAPGGPLPEESYNRLRSHHQELAFWEVATLESIDAKHWHFPPKEFIRHFRKCGWLSRNELTQLLPMNSLRKASTWQWEDVSLDSASTLLHPSNESAKNRRNDLNKSLQKYLITTPARQSCFFGNATQETQWYQKFHENSPYWYKPWDGRGFLQLTHATNYIEYWKFRGIPVTQQIKNTLRDHTTIANNNRPINNGQRSMHDPTNSLSDASTAIPQEIINRRNSVKESFDAANSAGAYWSWSGAAKQADSYFHTPASNIKAVNTNQGTKHYYENPAFGKVAATVNIGSPSTNYSSIWGVQARFMAFSNAQVVLMDWLCFTHADGSAHPTPQDFVYRRAPE